MLAYAGGLAAAAAAVALLGAAGEGGAPPLVGELDTVSRALNAALLATLVVLAGLFPVNIALHTRVSVNAAPLFAAVLLLGAPLGPAVAAAGVAGHHTLLWARGRRGWLDLVVNTAETMLSTTAAAHIVVSALSAGLPVGATLPLAAVAAAVTIYVTNLSLIGLAVALRGRRTGWRALRGLYVMALRATALQHAGLFLLGLLAALNAPQYPWVPLLTALPVVVIHFSFRANERLRVQTREAVEAMADLVDTRDPYTFGHCQRVAALAEAVAQHLGLATDQVELIRLAARVHDIGKIGVPDRVLLKPGPLDAAELALMQRHAEIGAALLANFPDYRLGRELVLSHHERHDGAGYPRGLARRTVPLGARIIAAVDTYDAMTTDRPYRRGLPAAVAAEELRRHQGQQWDPEVVDALITVLQDQGVLASPPPDASPVRLDPRSAPAALS